MTSIPDLNSVIPYKIRREFGACVHRTMSSLEDENTVVEAAPVTAIQRLLKVFTGVKPVLVFLSRFRVLPTSVQTAIGLLLTALESVSEAAPAITAQLEAGKDLQEEA